MSELKGKIDQKQLKKLVDEDKIRTIIVAWLQLSSEKHAPVSPLLSLWGGIR